jgi:hypothetical protein
VQLPHRSSFKRIRGPGESILTHDGRHVEDRGQSACALIIFPPHHSPLCSTTLHQPLQRPSRDRRGPGGLSLARRHDVSLLLLDSCWWWDLCSQNVDPPSDVIKAGAWGRHLLLFLPLVGHHDVYVHLAFSHTLPIAHPPAIAPFYFHHNLSSSTSLLHCLASYLVPLHRSKHRFRRPPRPYTLLRRHLRAASNHVDHTEPQELHPARQAGS